MVPNFLLSLIRLSVRKREGIKVIDLKDAYPTVMEDLQAYIQKFTGLKAAGQVWLLSNFDSQEDIAYPNDPKVPIKVDDDLKQLFRSIELPQDMIDIENDLQKNRMKVSTNMTQRRLAAQIHGISQKPKLKKKKHQISKRTKLTNVSSRTLSESERFLKDGDTEAVLSKQIPEDCMDGNLFARVYLIVVLTACLFLDH